VKKNKFIVKDGTHQVEAELVLFQKQGEAGRPALPKNVLALRSSIAGGIPTPPPWKIVGAGPLVMTSTFAPGVPAVSGVVTGPVCTLNFRDRVWDWGMATPPLKKAAALEDR